MQSALISLSALFFSSVIMGVAMAIAWGSFGRPRHALSWAIAYGLTALQALCDGITILIPSIEPYWWPFNDLLVIVPAALLAIGARQRVKLRDRKGAIVLSGAITFAAILVSAVVKTLDPIRETLASLFTAAMLLVAVVATHPRGRRADPAERAMLLVLMIFVAYELLLVALIFDTTAHPADIAMNQLYTVLYFVGLPSIFVATGIAAVLLMAADLAARLRRLAARDSLTGVHNRRGFREAAERCIANARRHRLPITVAVTDIDHFKAINDRFGHTAGDRTLGYISRMLASGVRQGDLVGRIGGEEFALLLIDSSATQAREVMDRIREIISNGFSEDGAPVPVTASFGVAEIEYGDGTSREMLTSALDRADRALYTSKIQGRNRVTLATT